MTTIRIDSVKKSPSGKSLLIKSGETTYFAKVDSGLISGMTIEAETKESEYQGKTNIWIERWKEVASAPQSSGATGQASDVMRFMPFVSNTVAHAIGAGLIKEPADVTMWAHAAMTAANELEDRPY